MLKLPKRNAVAVVEVVVEGNNRNAVAVVYSFTTYEVVLKKKVESRVDVGSMKGRFRVDIG